MLLALAPVVPHFRRGDAERDDRVAARCEPLLGVPAEITDNTDLAKTRHDVLYPRAPALEPVWCVWWLPVVLCEVDQLRLGLTESIERLLGKCGHVAFRIVDYDEFECLTRAIRVI